MLLPGANSKWSLELWHRHFHAPLDLESTAGFGFLVPAGEPEEIAKLWGAPVGGGN
jgi:hypothetical protein